MRKCNLTPKTTYEAPSNPQIGQIQSIPRLLHVPQVLMDACKARGRDIIIISTELGVNGGPVTRHYLNVPPSPDTSPVPCMSPSDIVLKTSSPNSPEGENVFNFRGPGE